MYKKQHLRQFFVDSPYNNQYFLILIALSRHLAENNQFIVQIYLIKTANFYLIFYNSITFTILKHLLPTNGQNDNF